MNALLAIWNMSNSIDQNSKPWPVEVAILIVVIAFVIGVFTVPVIVLFAIGVSATLLHIASCNNILSPSG